jgi:Rhodopirellula transposase DDE domain
MESSENPSLSPSQISDLRFAAAKMNLVDRRSFQAEMTLKYCDGKARLAETRFGWGRESVELGLAEKRTGIICIGAQSGYSGAKRWEDKYPEASATLRLLAEAESQQEPTFQSSLAYTRLTTKSALKALEAAGVEAEILPSENGMGLILNRLGYRLRKVVKAKPKKKYLRPMRFLRMSKRKITLMRSVVSND